MTEARVCDASKSRSQPDSRYGPTTDVHKITERGALNGPVTMNALRLLSWKQAVRM
jgi:hypothetical protein